MNPKQNISLINAMIRITCGFTFLAWSIAKLSKRPYKQSYLFIAFLAGMKIAEGIVRYCPIVALYEKRDTVFSMNQPIFKTEDTGLKAERQENHSEKATATDEEVAKIMQEFNPADIFSPDDMKK